MRDETVSRAREVFGADLAATPSVTLRGGDAMDGYREAPPYEPTEDQPTDAYLERYAFNGLPYVDAGSWRHYLPRLIEYAFRHRGNQGTMVVEGLLSSLRPPDRVPPRLASLTPVQEAVIRDFLEHLALGDAPNHNRDYAMQVLEEWWLPNALYRR